MNLKTVVASNQNKCAPRDESNETTDRRGTIIRVGLYGGVISINIGRGQPAIPSVHPSVTLASSAGRSLSFVVSLRERKTEVVAGPTRARYQHWSKADDEWRNYLGDSTL